MIKEQIIADLKKTLTDLKISGVEPVLEHPAQADHGDYSTNVAMVLAKKVKKNPLEVAREIVKKLQSESSPSFLRAGKLQYLEKIEAVAPGFINFWLKTDYLGEQVDEVLKEKDGFGKGNILSGQKIMVEFAHPNTHKELHIGHMRTLITGEALARIFAAAGAKVFRANYQGDIGPHVAKAIWGTENILKDKGTSWDEAEGYSLSEKAHLLGQGYVQGNKEYDTHKQEIDDLNTRLYKKDPRVFPVYERTRKWSLDYYQSFYERFYTQFDQLYFESEVADCGKKIVLEKVGKVFEESDGAIIFPGEKYGLHTRVFVTKDGNPTYEGKDMCLAPKQFADFPFDKCVHVVANEQTGYFQVIIKALELIDPKFVGREYHLPMGMVNLIGKKISSRTGEIITVDDLLENVKGLLKKLIKDLEERSPQDILEMATVAAVKYSVLKNGPTMNAAFDIEKSVSLEGDSGPYLQYTYARCKSVLAKADAVGGVSAGLSKIVTRHPLQEEELSILRTLYRFPEVVETAAQAYAPNLICSYLFDLAQKYNLFYNRHSILKAANPELVQERLSLTAATAQVIKNGLYLLGIKAPEKM